MFVKYIRDKGLISLIIFNKKRDVFIFLCVHHVFYTFLRVIRLFFFYKYLAGIPEHMNIGI